MIPKQCDLTIRIGPSSILRVWTIQLSSATICLLCRSPIKIRDQRLRRRYHLILVCRLTQFVANLHSEQLRREVVQMIISLEHRVDRHIAVSIILNTHLHRPTSSAVFPSDPMIPPKHQTPQVYCTTNVTVLQILRQVAEAGRCELNDL